MNLWNFVLETLAAAVSSFVSLSGAVRMCGPKYGGKKHALLLFAGVLLETGAAVLIDCFSLYRISEFSLWEILLNAVMSFLILLLLGGGTAARRAASAAVVTLAVSAVNFFVFCVTGIVLGVNYSSYNRFAVMMHPGFGRRCYLLALAAVLLALWFALRRVFPRAREWDRRQWAAALLGPAAAFSAGWYLRRIAFRKYWLITGYTLTLLGAAVLSVLIWAFYRYRKEKRANEMLYASNEIMTENYRQLYEDQMQRAKELHDFNHHISALRGLALEGKSAEAAAYADSLLTVSYREKRLCHSGSDVVDAVINRKAAEAEAAGIAFSYSVDFPVPGSLDPVDVCAILANQLDNALEACRSVDSAAPKSVEVRIWRQTEGIIFFQVINTALKNPFTPDGRLVSQKRDKARPHGLGLKSIRDTAKKHQGDLRSVWRDGKFTSTVFLCFDETEE